MSYFSRISRRITFVFNPMSIFDVINFSQMKNSLISRCEIIKLHNKKNIFYQNRCSCIIALFIQLMIVTLDLCFQISSVGSSNFGDPESVSLQDRNASRGDRPAPSEHVLCGFGRWGRVAIQGISAIIYDVYTIIHRLYCELDIWKRAQIYSISSLRVIVVIFVVIRLITMIFYVHSILRLTKHVWIVWYRWRLSAVECEYTSMVILTFTISG